MSGRKFRIWVEVCKVDSDKFQRRQYTVEAETRASAERQALVIAKDEWDDAVLPPERAL